MQQPLPLTLVTLLGRRLDAVVCAGSIANAARSVDQDQVRASQREDARAAFAQLEVTRLEPHQHRAGDPVVDAALVAVPDQRRHG